MIPRSPFSRSSFATDFCMSEMTPFRFRKEIWCRRAARSEIDTVSVGSVPVLFRRREDVAVVVRGFFAHAFVVEPARDALPPCSMSFGEAGRTKVPVGSMGLIVRGGAGGTAW